MSYQLPTAGSRNRLEFEPSEFSYKYNTIHLCSHCSPSSHPPRPCILFFCKLLLIYQHYGSFIFKTFSLSTHSFCIYLGQLSYKNTVCSWSWGHKMLPTWIRPLKYPLRMQQNQLLFPLHASVTQYFPFHVYHKLLSDLLMMFWLFIGMIKLRLYIRKYKTSHRWANKRKYWI